MTASTKAPSGSKKGFQNVYKGLSLGQRAAGAVQTTASVPQVPTTTSKKVLPRQARPKNPEKELEDALKFLFVEEDEQDVQMRQLEALLRDWEKDKTE